MEAGDHWIVYATVQVSCLTVFILLVTSILSPQALCVDMCCPRCACTLLFALLIMLRSHSHLTPCSTFCLQTGKVLDDSSQTAVHHRKVANHY